MTSKTDSTSESTIEPQMLAYGFVRCDDFITDASGNKLSLLDKLGESFTFKQDWKHVKSGLPAESKFCVLNTKTSKASAKAGMLRARKSRAERGQSANKNLLRYDQLQHGWNHSDQKQALVQKALTAYGFLVFFETAPTFEEMAVYVSKGLFAIPMSLIPTYMLNLQLQPTGGSSLQVNYTLDTGERAVFSLGPYTPRDDDYLVCKFTPGEKAKWTSNEAAKALLPA